MTSQIRSILIDFCLTSTLELDKISRSGKRRSLCLVMVFQYIGRIKLWSKISFHIHFKIANFTKNSFSVQSMNVSNLLTVAIFVPTKSQPLLIGSFLVKISHLTKI